MTSPPDTETPTETPPADTPTDSQLVEAVKVLEAIDVADAGTQDQQYFSVTTILKALSSPGLEYWAIQQAAFAAIDSKATWQAMLEDQGRAETVKWLVGARFRKPKLTLGAAELGTVVHKVCEMYALSGEKPTREYCTDLVAQYAAPTIDIDQEVHVVGQMLQQFDIWLQRFQPEYVAAEMAVYSPTYGYAGQLDAILTIDGVRFCVDYKSRREPLTNQGKPQTPYGETAMQLAAYRHADMAAVWRPRRVEKFKRRFYLLSPEETELAVPVPEVDSGLCILLTPQSCEAYSMRCDEDVFASFLYAFEIFRWSDQISKTVVGDPLIAPGE